MVGVTPAEIAAREFAALDAMIREARPRPGDTRTCPSCGRPQHYTGAELGWCHDALVDTWHRGDPAKPETRCEGCGMLTELTCPSCGRVFCSTCLVVHRRGMSA